jgi:hypothetical protein
MALNDIVKPKSRMTAIITILPLLLSGVFLATSTIISSAEEVVQAAAAQQEAPTEGYGGPTGPLAAVRHVYDDPTLRVFHYCKPNDKIMMICQLYDSNLPNATLVGIEYMITVDAYNALPNREKPNWHYHVEEFAPNRADPKFPQLSEQEQNATLKKLENSYGKIIITWNPNDNAPAFPPQVQIVQHPFMINKTVIPETETQSGSFNQTLKY